jgi:hypothetical protein
LWNSIFLFFENQIKILPVKNESGINNKNKKNYRTIYIALEIMVSVFLDTLIQNRSKKKLVVLLTSDKTNENTSNLQSGDIRC